jgi:uncharacterized phage protein gp47/JayE
MKPVFTPAGIQVQTFDEIYAELADGYRAIYGVDINLDPDSPDGQRVAIEAQARLDLQTFGLTLYQQMDPDFSFGQSLNRIIKLAGIVRRVATRSQVDATITTDRILTIPAGYAVEDTIGQSWITLTSANLSAGANIVTLFSQDFGAVEADAETITEQVTFVIGVLSVTNPIAATVGVEEETDEELRIRRNLSTENPAFSTTGSLFASLANMLNVTKVAVYENDTSITDTERDMPPHSIWCVVEGGAVDDIIETIAKNKTQGCDRKGDIEGSYTETLTKPDGSTFTIVHVMKFDRPTYVPLFIRLNVLRKDPLVPIDETMIEQRLVARSFDINEDCIASDLYRSVYESGNTFIATDLEISLDGMAWTDGRLDAFYDEIFEIDVADIDITEVA